MMLPWLENVHQQLMVSFASGRFHHAQLFNGLEGVGKQLLVKQLADALLCVQAESLIACGQCKSCLLNQADTHPDKRSIRVDGQSIGVDEIREISEFMQHSAAQNGNKVVVLQQCHKMTTAAANALLKTLEEPSAGRYLLLTTEHVSQLPATVLSRCARSDVKVTDTAVAKQWLANLNINDYSWLSLFVKQPLLVEKWQADEQLGTIDLLYKFATEIKDSHNFSALVDIFSKDHALIGIFVLFLTEQLKQQLIAGMDFFVYQKAQQALTEFIHNSSKVLGLNLSLAISRLAFTLRECNK
ncbi:AAA family ATPase [Pseudoalteromonas mariniglutinosa]|uniref:AAA family ATPase n=1 Tax=Pseudoalteromonas mariniglutinosa TaxID=206042 RepID=UPI00384A8040